jgi:predicted Holliday junction resolvase-like endonuclease
MTVSLVIAVLLLSLFIFYYKVYNPLCQIARHAEDREKLLVQALHDKALAKAQVLETQTQLELSRKEFLSYAEAETSKREAWQANQEKRIREDAAKRSSSTQNGFLYENFAPLISLLNPKDFRHLCDPIDYLVITGYTEVAAGTKKEVDEVLLLDVKYGTSQLTTSQRRVRDAIQAGRIAFAVYSPQTGIRYWRPNVQSGPTRPTQIRLTKKQARTLAAACSRSYRRRSNLRSS